MLNEEGCQFSLLSDSVVSLLIEKGGIFFPVYCYATDAFCCFFWNSLSGLRPLLYIIVQYTTLSEIPEDRN